MLASLSEVRHSIHQKRRTAGSGLGRHVRLRPDIGLVESKDRRRARCSRIGFEGGDPRRVPLHRIEREHIVLRCIAVMPVL